jgi:putative membrane protein (TIGR04086 family)
VRTGVLVDILIVILNTVLAFLIFLVLGHLDQGQTASQVANWSGTIVALLLTAYGAERVASKVESGAILHGFLTGLVAALIFFLLGLVFLAFGARFDLLALVYFVLMVAAGWLGGILGSRGREKS